jgi:hypothetical protein
MIQLVVQLMAKDGIKSYALDMPGCGYSTWPQPGYDFEFNGDSVKGALLLLFSSSFFLCEQTCTCVYCSMWKCALCKSSKMKLLIAPHTHTHK